MSGNKNNNSAERYEATLTMKSGLEGPVEVDYKFSHDVQPGDQLPSAFKAMGAITLMMLPMQRNTEAEVEEIDSD